MDDLFSRAKAEHPDEPDEAIQQGIEQLRSAMPTASDDQLLEAGRNIKQQVGGEAQAAPTPAIQNPMVKDHIQKLYGDKFSDSARQKLVDENAADASGPNFTAGLAALGAGLQGRDAAAAGQAHLKMQQDARDSRLTNFDKARAGKLADYKTDREMQTDVDTDARNQRERDPGSAESKMAQSLAIDMGMKPELVANLTAEKFKTLSPVLEKKYEIEQKKLDRKDARTAKLDATKEKASEGQKAVDRDFAKDYNEWTSGGQASADKNIQRLEDTKKILAKHKDDWVGTSGRITGRLPDALRSEESIRLRQDVQAAAQGALRATLGPQFTEKEGERIMAAAYDEKLSPQENIKKIDAALKELQTAKNNKIAKSKHFENKSTLAGYRAMDSGEQTANSGDTVQIRDPQGKVRLIPKSQVDAALAAGGSMVEGTAR